MERNQNMRAWLRAAFCAVAAFMSGAAVPAAEYPAKPITFVVPGPAGGPTDILARMLADDMRQAWGQPIVVDNRGGAGGLIATQLVQRSPADGYTLLLAFAGHLTNPALNPKAAYDPVKDFTPISLLANAGAVLAYPPSLHLKDWNDFVSYARKKPGGISIGNPGTGTSSHIYAEMLREATGLNITSVPYKGEAPLYTDLLGGTVDFGFISIGPYVRFSQAGKLKGLATTLRSQLIPDLPTFADLGVPGPGRVRGWFGVIAPAGVPPEVVDKLSKQIRASVTRPEVASKLVNEMALVPVGSTPEEFGAILKAEYGEWVRAIREFNIQLDN